jgi:hypothetical protein
MPGVVIVSVRGGIGNQLFCWAAAYAAARRAGLDLVLECSSYKRDDFGRVYLLPKLDIDSLHKSSYNLLERVLIQRLAWLAMRNHGYIRLPGCKIYTDDPGVLNQPLLNSQLSGRCYLWGYWQSDRYFKDYRNDVRQAVRLRPCSDNHLTNDAVCVHIRSYKDVNLPSRFHLPKQYYHAAYARCFGRLGRPRFVVYSDDMQWAQEKGLLPEAYEVGGTSHASSCGGHDLCDLVAMSQFHNFVIANSSFSWWAAYLSDADAWIQAPALDRACWFNEDPLPAEWDIV